MLCKLCQAKDADKSNTHYLTDAIIRSCLNYDGSNKRLAGSMFDMSSGRTTIESNFQQATPLHEIEKVLGREPTDEEIDKAKEKTYAVDYYFCKACEDEFTTIENSFLAKLLPVFRGHDFTGKAEIAIAENVLFRKFFLLQVWRAAVCDPDFQIDAALEKSLREIIYNEKTPEEKIVAIPLSVTYTNTLGPEFEYTRNFVGVGVHYGHYIIFMNDFVVRAFETGKPISYLPCYGLTDPIDFDHFVNVGEKNFLVKVMDNDTRIEIWINFYDQEKVEQVMMQATEIFWMKFIEVFKQLPSRSQVFTYLQKVVENPSVPLYSRYMEVTLQQGADDYIRDIQNKKG